MQPPAEDTGTSTDKPLGELSDLERADLAAQLRDSQASQTPLVGQLEPLDRLADEYRNGSTVFTRKIDRLAQDGWTGIRRTRGDGDCFWRGKFATSGSLDYPNTGRMETLTLANPHDGQQPS